jgi:hypothetical protein
VLCKVNGSLARVPTKHNTVYVYTLIII